MDPTAPQNSDGVTDKASEVEAGQKLFYQQPDWLCFPLNNGETRQLGSEPILAQSVAKGHDPSVDDDHATTQSPLAASEETGEENSDGQECKRVAESSNEKGETTDKIASGVIQPDSEELKQGPPCAEDIGAHVSEVSTVGLERPATVIEEMQLSPPCGQQWSNPSQNSTQLSDVSVDNSAGGAAQGVGTLVPEVLHERPTAASGSAHTHPIALYANVVKRSLTKAWVQSEQLHQGSHDEEQGDEYGKSQQLIQEAQTLDKTLAATVWFRKVFGIQNDAYLEAAGQVVGDRRLVAINTDDRNRVEIVVSSLLEADELVRVGIVINGDWFKAYRVAEKPLKVSLTGVPSYVPHSALVGLLAPYGTCTAADVESVHAFTRRSTLRHIVTYRRNVWLRVDLNSRKLPPSLVLYFAGKPHTIEIVDNVIKCFLCGKTGHVRAKCPSYSPNFEPVGQKDSAPLALGLTPGTTTPASEVDSWRAGATNNTIREHQAQEPKDPWLTANRKKQNHMAGYSGPRPDVTGNRGGAKDQGKDPGGKPIERGPPAQSEDTEEEKGIAGKSPPPKGDGRKPESNHRPPSSRDERALSFTKAGNSSANTRLTRERRDKEEEESQRCNGLEGSQGDKTPPPPVPQAGCSVENLGELVKEGGPAVKVKLGQKERKRLVKLGRSYLNARRHLTQKGEMLEDPLDGMGVEEALELFRTRQDYFSQEASLEGIGEFIDGIAAAQLMDHSDGAVKKSLKRPAPSLATSTDISNSPASVKCKPARPKRVNQLQSPDKQQVPDLAGSSDSDGESLESSSFGKEFTPLESVEGTGTPLALEQDGNPAENPMVSHETGDQ